MEKDADIKIDLRRLRPYIEVLLRRWVWVISAAVVMALVALAINILIGRTYEAMALVAITKPQEAINFDPRFASVADIIQGYKVYPEIAKSDDLMQSLLAKLSPLPPPIQNIDDLRDALTANQGADPSIVRLKARVADPSDAARIANVWAELLIARVNEVYGTQDQQQLQFLEDQMANADKELQAAEQAVVTFQASDRSSILANELDSAQQKQSDYLGKQRSITYFIQDIAGLREQLSMQPAGNPSGLADRLSALFLQIKGYGAQASIPIQLQFSNPDTLASASVGEQITLLDNLNNVMHTQLSNVGARLKELEPQILDLQQQLQQVYTVKERISRNRDLARTTYTTLASKVDEKRIAVQNIRATMQLASSALPPRLPIGLGKIATAMLGGVAGLILGIIAVLALDEWVPALVAAWRRVNEETQQKRQQAGAVGQ